MKTASIISNLVYNKKLYKSGVFNKECEKYALILYLSLMVKHKSWIYEDEYRITYPETTVCEGVAKPFEELGLKVNCIYV